MRTATMLLFGFSVLLVAMPAALAQQPERRWDIELGGFFKGGTAPLYLYAREQGGQWVAVLGSSRKQYNTSYYFGDLSKAPIADGRFAGPVRVYMTPDPWQPADGKTILLEFTLDATVAGDTMTGTYTLNGLSGSDRLPTDFARAGKLTGRATAAAVSPMPPQATLHLNLQNAAIGGYEGARERCLALRLGVENGRLVRAVAARQGTKLDLSDAVAIDAPADALTYGGTRFAATVTFPYTTLDAEPATYAVTLDGCLLDGLLAGRFTAVVTPARGEVVRIAGGFDGRRSAGLPTLPTVNNDAWHIPVPGFVPVQPGEHPRLLFRKADVPGLRAKAETPAGKAMVARLKYLLGGGEAMPTQYNTNPPVNIGPRGPGQLKPGAFTMNHAAGFGLLYQLTGDAKYADLSRQCLDKLFAGQVDRDERYSWTTPGTGFRYSAVLHGVALAYDFCYDAWPEAYRRTVATAIETHAPKPLQGNEPLTLEQLADGGGYPPSSNHFGAYIGGTGIAVLAIRGDAGVDEARLAAVTTQLEVSLNKLMTNGFGDGGWLGEGAGSDTTSTQPGVTAWLQSLRVTAGQDWTGAPRPHARMLVLARVLELMPGGQRPDRGNYAYGTKYTGRALFSTGIGALPERYRPGMAWVYEHFIEPGKAPEERIYEATVDPLNGIYAFVNWPLDVPAESPTGVFPLAMQDTLHGYVLCRNRFMDGKDCLVTGLSRRGPTGYHSKLAPQRVDVWGLGLRTTMGMLQQGPTTHWQPGKDGSACFTIGGIPWAVDYSGASGAAAIIVNVGGPQGKAAAKGDATAAPVTLTAGGLTYNLLILVEGAAPEARVENDRIIIGGQTIICDGKKIALGTFAPAE